MPSNEAIELLENVLSNINESERWQYRQADSIKKKRDDLEKQIEAEKKKVEFYGKDPGKLKELKEKLYTTAYVDNDKLKKYRTGTNDRGRKLNPKDQFDKRYISDRHDVVRNSDEDILYTPLVNNGTHYERKLPKNKDMYDRIDKRTKAFDTTNLHNIKHEAACILIEALNTLLNE